MLVSVITRVATADLVAPALVQLSVSLYVPTPTPVVEVFEVRFC